MIIFKGPGHYELATKKATTAPSNRFGACGAPIEE